jgi:hypothetical protein
VLFANYDTFAEVDPVTKKTRAKGGRIRTLYTSRTAAYDAKNSWDGIPDQIDMEYNQISKYLSGEIKKEEPKQDRKIELRDMVKELAKPLGGGEYLKTKLEGRKFLDLSIEQMEVFIQNIKDDITLMENK